MLHYVVGTVEALSVVVSVSVLCRFPPSDNEAYHSSYALRPSPTVFKHLFYVCCLLGFLAVLVSDIWKSDGYCLNQYSVWALSMQIIYWSWSLQDPKCISRGRLILFDVVFPVSIVITVVVWLVLYPMAGNTRNDEYWNWISWSQHGLNTALLVVEFLWSDARAVGWSTCALVTLFPTTYTIYAWMLHASHPLTPWLFASFLPIDDPSAPFWFIALVALHAGVFAVVVCLAACKVRAIEQTPERIHLSLDQRNDHHNVMWGPVVVGCEEALSVVACIYFLRQFPPHRQDAYTSPYAFPSDPPSVLHRAFYAACAILLFVTHVADVIKTDGHCYYFFTTWNVLLQLSYWCWSFFDASGHSRGRAVMLDVLWPTSILVTAVVWAILYPMVHAIHEDYILLNWISYCQHGINAFLLLVEWIWNDARRVAVSTCAWSILFPTIYVIYAWIVHETVMVFALVTGAASLRTRAVSRKRVDTADSLVHLLVV
ncbi:hypothetical protein DYB34_003611 [Aphanomyces astaci]|uniref:Uncharacterized protein n=1 Tax=Aphanomyces astaci TaxID=112090 RepID=A0A396ZX95_APHAT|nr:hypothetical protein DYB36_010084 [Aphanomyces astaci]RHY62830.1 hypothetical protein DYB34_003611 [Aphanomyces astaci]